MCSSDLYDYTWGSWENHWTGTSTSTQYQGQIFSGRQIIDQYVTTTTQTGTATRSGVVSGVVPETITQNIGDRLVDLSIIPYMRSKGIVMVGTDFKPNVSLYPFFDTTAVEAYTARANKLTLRNNNLGYRTEVGNFEQVRIYDNNTATNVGTDRKSTRLNSSH